MIKKSGPFSKSYDKGKCYFSLKVGGNEKIDENGRDGEWEMEWWKEERRKRE